MFIVTAKVPRRKLLAGSVTVLCCCLAVAAALILTMDRGAVTASAESSGVRSNEGRIAYLNELGWQVSETPVITEELLIPESFAENYTEYLALQKQQGFDLSKYAGKRIKRYTYDITNYSDSQIGVQAAILVYKNKIIGGQLQASDGSFILPLTGQQ